MSKIDMCALSEDNIGHTPVFIFMMIAMINLIFIYKLIVPFKNIYDYTPYLMSFVVYVGGCYALITYKKTKYPSKTIGLLMTYLIIVVPISIHSLNTSQMFITTINTTAKIAFWVITFMVAYNYKYNKYNNLILKWFLMFAPLITIYYFYVAFYRFTVGYGTYINLIYYSLLLLPMVLVIKDNLIRAAICILMFIAVLLSVKINAILCFLGAIVLYVFVNSIIENSKLRKAKALLTIYIIIILVSIFLFIFDSWFNIPWLNRLNFHYMIESGAHDRFLIWKEIIEIQKQSTIKQWLWGHGFDGVSKYTKWKISAHNDYLEVLFDYGIVSFIVYVSFLVRLCSINLSMIKDKFRYAAAFTSSLFIVILMSFTSHLVYYPTYYIYITIFWGVVLAIYNRESEIYI